MSVIQNQQLPKTSPLRKQWRIMHAIMLRNIRTRMMGTFWGYLLWICWPLVHISGIVTIYSLLGRGAPYGDSPALFVATGAVTFQVFSYLARFMMMSTGSMLPLLSLPEVKRTDTIFASMVQDALTSCGVALILLSVGWALGIPVMPISVSRAAEAVGAALLLGVGWGTLNSVIQMTLPMWNLPYIGLNAAMWISSGTIFVPTMVPEPYRTYLSYNPALHLVEWMRSAYYEGYGDGMLDRTYLISFALASLMAGLVLERITRSHYYAHR